MHPHRTALFLAAASLTASAALAQPSEKAALTVSIPALGNDGSIPPKYAFCQPDAATRTKDGGNVSPEISWNAGPEGTRSYAIIMDDPDVPAKFDDANKEGKILPQDMPRQTFTHWVLVDIPADITRLPEGADANGVEKPGKPAKRTHYGLRGLNDYGKFMGGQFAGYDGPCPPWNDLRLHHFHFTVLALDVPALGLSGGFTPEQAKAALENHVLARGEAVGTYTQNAGPQIKALF